MLSLFSPLRTLLLIGGVAFTPIAFTAEEPAAAPAAASPASQPAAAAPIIDVRADEVVRKMSKCLADAKGFRFIAEQEFDVVDATGMKIQNDRRLEVRVAKPQRVLAFARGRDWDRAYAYDGARVTLMDRNAKTYSQVACTGTIGQMLDLMAERFGLSVPTGDFLFDDVHAALTDGMQIGRYLGKASVGGAECHHVAYSSVDVDWQLWITDGEKPLPKKFVVVRKTDRGAPQFMARFVEWQLDETIDDAKLKLDVPADFEKLELAPSDS